MSQLGTAYVQIVPSAQGISGKIQKVISPEADAAGKTAGNKIAGGMQSKLSSVSSKLFRAGAIATAVSVPIIAGIKKAMGAYQIQSAAETKLTEIYKTRMGATKGAAKETMKLASALQKEGVIGDEVTLSGAQQLATFAKYPKTVNKLLPAMGNLLAQQKGVNATSEDAVNIGNLMGKVMQGQTGALKRVGVTFDENQEKILKYGTEEEKAATLAEVITSNVGNMNKTMAKTPEGKIQQMKNSLGDMAEEVGRVLAPALANLAKWVSTKVIPKLEKFFQFMNEHPRIKKLALVITGLAVAIGPVLMAISTFIRLWTTLKIVMSAMTGPIGLIITAIGLLVVGFIYLWKKSKAFRDFWKKLWNGIKVIVHAVVTVIVGYFRFWYNAIKRIWSGASKFFSGIAHRIKNVFHSIPAFFREKFSAAWSAVKRIFSGVGRFFSGIASTIRDKFSSLGSKIGSAIGGAMKSTINAVLQFIENRINGAIDLINGAIRVINKVLPKKVEIGSVKHVSLPRLAQGGVLARGQTGFLEGSGAEAVVPLERNKEWIGRVADDMQVALGSTTGGRAVNITINNKIDGAEKPEEYAARLVRQLKVEMRTI